MESQSVRPGRYRHFKGGEVEVIGVGKHSETLEGMVVYRHTGHDAGDLWIRPLGMFLETVEKDGEQIPRFEYKV